MEAHGPLETILERLSEIGARLEHVQRDVSRINGRISALEKWQIEKIAEEAFERGQREARREAVLTKGHLAAIGTIVAAVSALSGLLVRFI